jgi:outer membrane lipase/esterase
MQELLTARRRLIGLVAASASALVLSACGGSSDAPPQFPPLVVGQKYTALYAVGASLSDTGNACTANPSSCPPSPPYAAGVASNGTLWIQTVATNYRVAANPSLKGGTNYAYGGARTGAVPSPVAGAPALTGTVPSMVQQLDTYLATTSLRADPGALYVVDGSTYGNNFNAAATAAAQAGLTGAAQQTYFTNVTAAAVGDIIGIINKLYFAGARNVLVLNVPDLGGTPLLTGNGAAPTNPNAQAGTALSAGYNQNLAAQITTFAPSWQGMSIKTFDSFTFARTMAANPAANGYTNVTQACFLPPSASLPSGFLCTTPNSYFYWDSFHPTAFTGSKVAQQVITLLGP